MAEAKLVSHNCSPAICINGKIYPPMAMTVTTCRTALGLNGRKLDYDYFKELGNVGIRIFYVMCNNLSIDENAVSELEKGPILSCRLFPMPT